MRPVLLLAAVCSLAGGPRALATEARERAALREFLIERQGPLEERIRVAFEDLEAKPPGEGPARALWGERLVALQREWELLQRLQARTQSTPDRALEVLGAQLAWLDSALALGVAPSEAPPPSGCGASGLAPTATGRITGTVRRSDTSAPVSGAVVTVYTCTGSYAATDTTDGAGLFDTGAVLGTGQYYLVVDSNPIGLVNEMYPDVVCYGCSPRMGSLVAVTDGATTAGIDFSLAPGTQLVGSVKDAGAAGIPAQVVVSTPDGHFDMIANTDGTGAFATQSGLPPGDYILSTYVGDSNFINECYPGDVTCPYPIWAGDLDLPRLTVSSPGTLSGLAIVLGPGATISGTVLDAGASPLSGVSITVGLEDGSQLCSVTTNASGSYSCKGLPAGSYVLRASKSGYITQLYLGLPCIGCTTRGGNLVLVSAGAAVALANITLATEGAIAGTVHNGTGPGAPAIAGATVTAHGVKGVQLASATTDATGAFRIGRLTSGSYLVKVTAPGFVQGLHGVGPCPGCAVTAGSNVSVTAGFTATIADIPLAPAATLTGIVQSSLGPALASVSVRAYDITGRLLGQDSTDCSGQYQIDNLETGSYYVQTQNSQGYIDEAGGGVQCYTCTPATGAMLALTAGVTSNLNFALDPVGRIGGVVTDLSTGRLLGQQYVYVYDALGVFQTSAMTDERGRYGTRALAPGTYYLLVITSDRYRRQFYGAAPCDFSCVPPGGTAVVVAGSPVTANITLQRGGGISGRVLSGTWFTPLSSSYIEVFHSSGAFVDYGFSYYSGNWATRTGLPAGSYYLLSEGGAGYLPQLHSGTNCFPLNSCTPLSGTPVAVSGTGFTASSAFFLTQAAHVSGRVLVSAAWPASSVPVDLYSGAGALVASTASESSGFFRFPVGFPAGSYFLRSRGAAAGYVDAIFSGVSCSTLACTVTGGTPIALSGTNAAFLNFTISSARARKGDFNKDQSTDLALRNVSTNLHRYWLMNGTTRTLEGDFSPSTPAANLAVTGVDDFDIDGYNDLVFWNSSTGAVEVWRMGGASGITRQGSPIPLGTPSPALPWRLSSTADFNRDGSPDLLYRNSSTQKIEIWRMSGVTKVSTLIPTPDQAVDANWEIVATLDWNGDGYVDFLWYNPVSGKIVLWFMDAAYKRVTGIFTTPANAGANNWKVVAGGDYSVGAGGLPGTIDIVWRNGTSGKLVVWHMNQHGTRTAGVFTSPDAPAPPLEWTVVGPR